MKNEMLSAGHLKCLVLLGLVMLIGIGCTSNIHKPGDGSVFIEGQEIAFSGSGKTLCGSAIPGNQLIWISDMDGEIGTGASINTPLSVGEHTIALQFSKSHKTSNLDSIKISVITIPDELPAPKFNPPEGQYDKAIDVEITCAISGVKIYYNVDGTNPTEESEEYKEPVHINKTSTIKAIAMYEELKSPEAEAEYLIGCKDSGSSFGDPHFVTFDGFVYHNQYIGEFVLSRETDENGFEVQARQAELSSLRPCVTSNTAVAIRVDDNIIEYRAGSNELLVDGTTITLSERVVHTLSGGGIVKRSKGIVCNNASGSVSVRAKDQGSYLNIVVTVSCPMKNSLEGLLGNYDENRTNEFSLRNEEQANSAGDFVDDWRLQDVESLFTYAPGKNTETHTGIQYCNIHLTPENIENARALFSGLFGADACDEAMVTAMATDLAAGMTEKEVLEWVENIKGYVTPSGTIWFKDADGDKYGTDQEFIESCDQPEGYVDNSLDCDDDDADVNPGSDEVDGDGIDNNCNGMVDETCDGSAIDVSVYQGNSYPQSSSVPVRTTEIDTINFTNASQLSSAFGFSFSFALDLRSEFNVPVAGEYIFQVISDDGFYIGFERLGSPGGPALVGTPHGSNMSGAPATTLIEGYPVATAFMSDRGASGTTMRIHFPEPGLYSFELVYRANHHSYSVLRLFTQGPEGSGINEGGLAAAPKEFFCMYN